MGVRTAPVAGSGARPPRTAVVANSSGEKVIESSNRELPRNSKTACHPRRPVTIGVFCLGCQAPNVDTAPPRVHMAMVVTLATDNISKTYRTGATAVKI